MRIATLMEYHILESRKILRESCDGLTAEQQIIPYTGTWKISLCNNREAQRQSLTTALRPKADL